MEGGGWKREAGRGMAVAHASWLGLGGYIGNLAPSAIAPGPRISQGLRGVFPGTGGPFPHHPGVDKVFVPPASGFPVVESRARVCH